MVQVVYGNPKIPIEVITKQLCVHGCRPSPEIDPKSGYTLGWWCKRPPESEGLCICAICEREFIDPNKYQDSNYETSCPECVIQYEL